MSSLKYAAPEEGVRPVYSGFQRTRSERRWLWQRRVDNGAGYRLLVPGSQTAAEVDATRKEREHIDYLKRMAAEGVVPPALATKAKAVWWVARASADDALPVPAAAAFPGGPVEYH